MPNKKRFNFKVTNLHVMRMLSIGLHAHIFTWYEKV